MTEAGQFVGFCQAGGFVIDLVTDHVDWFREGNGNYILVIWFVPHDTFKSLVDIMDKPGFQRPPK